MTLLLGVLLASVAGSVHCAAMCGGFVCVYSGGRAGMVKGAMPHVAYNAGRLTSYLLLGLGAGFLGARLNDLGVLVGVARAAAIVAGMLMVVWALHEIALAAGARFGLPGTESVAWVKRTIGRALIVTRNRTATERAGALGLLTTLLPCGWLYAFVVTATSTGNALSGAMVMSVFWAGTVPVLLGVGLGAQRLLGPFGRRLPLASAIIVLVIGLLSIAGRVTPPGQHSGPAHGRHGGPESGQYGAQAHAPR